MLRYGIFLGLLFVLFFVKTEFSHAILFDSFDSYSTGNVTSVTTDWEDYGDGSFSISNLQSFSGSNSLRVNDPAGTVYTPISASFTGLQHQFRYYGGGTRNTHSVEVVSEDLSLTTALMQVVFIPTSNLFGVAAQGGGTDYLDTIYQVPDNEWILVTMDIDFVNSQIRARWESTSTTTPWTNWVQNVTYSTSTPTHLTIDGNTSGGDFYIDDWGNATAPTSGNFLTTGIHRINSPQPYQLLYPDSNGLSVATFNFTYYVASSSYDYVGYELQDVTNGVTYAPVEELVSATGTLRTFTDNLVLEGSEYNWRPYIRNSTTGQKIYANLIGSYYPFNVIGGSGRLDVDEWLADFWGSSTSSNPNSSSTVVMDYGIQIASTSVFCSDYENLCTKFPFSYAVDFVGVYRTFANAAVGDPSDVQYQWDVAGATGTIMLIDTNSTTSIMQAINLIRTYADYALYFLFAVWAFGFANKFL